MPWHSFHQKRGLKFWFNALEGYNKKIVIEFYQNMKLYIEEPNEKDNRVESKVGRIPILVTPDQIAEYLNYTRPPPTEVNYPRANGESIGLDIVKAALYEDVRDYMGKHAPGFFKEDYRFINKVIYDYANLYPRESKTLSQNFGAALLYVFMNDKYVIDVAEMIFLPNRQFQTKHPILGQNAVSVHDHLHLPITRGEGEEV